MTGAPRIMGKKDLAAALGWARTTLDRRLQSDPAFPIVARGDQSGGWQLDLDAVRRGYNMAERPPAAPETSAAPAIDEAQLRDAIAPALPRLPQPAPPPPRRSAYHPGEATARQRKDEADAALREDRLRQQRGELVSITDVRATLQQVFATLGHAIDALPEKLVKLCDLPEDAAGPIRPVVDQIRREMVRVAQEILETEHA